MDEFLSNDVEYGSSSDDMADDQSFADISDGDESPHDPMRHPQQEDQVEGDNDPTQTFNSAIPGKCIANTNQQTIPTRLPRRHDPSLDAPSTSGMMTGVSDLQSPNQIPDFGMDGDLSDDRTDRDSGEHATNHLSHENSDDSHTELNHGTDLMHRIPLYPQLKTDLVNFTLPEEIPSPQAAVGRVVPPAVAQQQYQQLSRQQQLRLHPISLCFPNPLRYSLIPMYFPISLITIPRQPSSQMNLGHLTAQRNPAEIRKLEDKLQSFHITKKPKSEIDSRIDGVLQKAHSASSAGEVPDEKMSRNDCCDSDEEINVVDCDDDTNEDPSAPLKLAPLGSITSKPTTKEQSGPTPPNAIKDPSNDAPRSSGMMSGVKSLKSPNQVEVEKDTTGSFNSALFGRFLTKTNQQTLPTRLSRNDYPSHNPPICSYMVTGVTDLQSPNQCLVRRSKKRIPERMKLKKEIQALGEKFKNRRLELDQTQKDVARQLNKLCRKHNVDLRLLPSSISQLENQKLGLKKFLKLKPQLEFWMENSNTENLHSLANKPESTVRGRRTKNHMSKVSREYLMQYFHQNPNANLREMKKLAILIKRNIKFVCNWFYWQKSKKKERNVKNKKKEKNAVINPFPPSDTAHATSSLNTISSAVYP